MPNVNIHAARAFLQRLERASARLDARFDPGRHAERIVLGDEGRQYWSAHPKHENGPGNGKYIWGRVVSVVSSRAGKAASGEQTSITPSAQRSAIGTHWPCGAAYPLGSARLGSARPSWVGCRDVQCRGHCHHHHQRIMADAAHAAAPLGTGAGAGARPDSRFPVLNWRDWLSSTATAASRARFLEQLRDAAVGLGFFHLQHSPLDSGSLRKDLFDLSAQFFALPLEQRLAISMTNSPHFRGYSPFAEERTLGAVDNRDQVRHSAALLAFALLTPQRAMGALVTRGVRRLISAPTSARRSGTS